MAPNIRLWKREAAVAVDDVTSNILSSTIGPETKIFGHKHHRHHDQLTTTTESELDMGKCEKYLINIYGDSI